MEGIKVGDIVGRISYSCDIFFKVVELTVGKDGKKSARLKGLDKRLCATAPVEDLRKFEPAEVAAFWHSFMTKNHEHMKRIFQRREQDRQRLVRGNDVVSNLGSFDVPGSVLHMDGDGDYLDLCLTTYRQLGIPASGYHIDEEKQPEVVIDLLQQHRPDILVLTGHDGIEKDTQNFSDLNSYHNSRYFVEAVKKARLYEKSRDDLVIFAGACQSHYEAILEAGANFASSPHRVLIHTFDPVFVVEKIAYTSIYDQISLKDIIAGTITGFPGIGGVETRGKYRLGLPKSPY
ncbi:spore coat assembly protein [Desulfofundulus luciae]|uniref:Spore coat assembly protein n=1 Tax=Desulfofundulus luciae TaxID=74702 RepID=A0ABU0AXS2_9FIRM|nr:sporulation peptidase YabG [Desulfofundulus luciae]MDQ0285270.1 spore coat assembly protein [Desulfofundulus luciae]